MAAITRFVLIFTVLCAALLGTAGTEAQPSFGAIPDLSPGIQYPLGAAGIREKSVEALPAQIDNRRFLPPVKNQAACGSCTIFAATALLEGTIQREYGASIGPLDPGIPSLMEQFTIDCGFPLNGCESGWYMPAALASVVEFGATSWSALAQAGGVPRYAYSKDYVPNRANCQSFLSYLAGDSSNYRFRPFEFVKINAPSMDVFKAAIVDYGILATTLNWQTVRVDSNNVISFVPCVPGDSCGGHAVVVVGYDDARRAFLIRNSWGPYAAHSEGGYQWMSYDEYSPTSVSRFGYTDGGFYIMQRRPELPREFAPTLVDDRPRISVVVAGDGSGVVEATSGAQLSCAPTCIQSVEQNTQVTLRARADPGSSFSHWEGCDVSAGNECTIVVGRDQTVASVFNAVQTDSEFDPGLLAVLGNRAQDLINAPYQQYASNRGLVVPRGISKYRTLVLEDNRVVFDPTFIVEDGRYNSALNDGVSALVVKYVQIPSSLISGTGPIHLEFKGPDPAATNLSGVPGVDGTRGTDGPSRGQCGGNGGSGSPGGFGTSGQSGKSRQYDSVVAISIGTFVDELGRVIPPERVRISLDFGGYDGGNGGNGGYGGSGGNGGRGGDGRSNIFDCACGPGAGGNGGAGGVGGDAGSGGDAGHGANLYLFLPQDFAGTVGSFNVTAGRAGSRGFAGLSGVGGSGGSRGSSPGLCTADGVGPGAPGATPGNIVSNARDGLAGASGDFVRTVFGRSGEHAERVASAGFASDLLRGIRRLTDVQVSGVVGDRISLAWNDLSPELGPLTISAFQSGTLISSGRIDSSRRDLVIEVGGPGEFEIEIVGIDSTGGSALLARIPVPIPAREVVESANAVIWSASGGRSRETLLAKFNQGRVSAEEFVDVYVLAVVPSGSGDTYFFLNQESSWVPVTDFKSPPKHRSATRFGDVGLLAIVSDFDLSASNFTGTTVYVGFGRKYGANDTFATMLQESSYSSPFVVR